MTELTMSIGGRWILILLTFCVLSCTEKHLDLNECDKFKTPEYSLETADATLLMQAEEYHEILLDRFKENSIVETHNDGYHLLFYSSHGYGKSVKFEKRNNNYILSLKCVGKKEWNDDCKQYRINIEEDEWDVLEKMIYEFDFWTADHFRTNTMVLDGSAFLLEGNRPNAKSCNVITTKLIARGSPQYDKIGNLCDNILEYEGQLRFRYEQFNRIN